jgi:hypothetical protein
VPIVAINAANGSGRVTIKPAVWCTCRRTAASSPNVMSGRNGLPTIASRIILNGLTITSLQDRADPAQHHCTKTLIAGRENHAPLPQSDLGQNQDGDSKGLPRWATGYLPP